MVGLGGGKRMGDAVGMFEGGGRGGQGGEKSGVMMVVVGRRGGQ